METKNLSLLFDRWKEVFQQYKSVVLVIVVGVLFLLLPSTPVEEAEYSHKTEYDITAFELHLAENLSLVQGAGKTKVVLTLRNDGETVYAQDIQEDAAGKNSRSTVTVGSGAGEQVVEIEQRYPQFQGALIVCEGGDNPSVQLKLIEAVSSLTGLGSDRITVCKSN